MRRRVAVDGARAVARRLLTVLEPPNCTLAQLRKRSSKLEPDHRMCDDISAGHGQSRWLHLRISFCSDAKADMDTDQ